MSNNTILWVQSTNHSGEDYLYVDGSLVNRDHCKYSLFVEDVLSIDYKRIIMESESLSIYQSEGGYYQIASNLVEKDDVGRCLAFIAKISANSYEDIAPALENLINACGYQIDSTKILLIDDGIKKKAKLNHLRKTSVSILVSVIMMIVLISMCRK